MKFITGKLDRIIAFFIPPAYRRVFRYLIAGGTAAATDLILLFVFTSVLHIWYLLSAIMAFLIAFGVSFTLQKFWTFDDQSTDRWKAQATIYMVIAAINLGLNTLLMYVAVDVGHFHYFISQFVISGLLAFEQYFIYQIFVFKKKAAEVAQP
ncbi:MAG: GtrA family protein [Patescibacteria group bacterium]